MLKSTVQRILRETCAENGQDYDRDTRWVMFCNVCDNLLKEGTITYVQHQRWTSPF